MCRLAHGLSRAALLALTWAGSAEAAQQIRKFEVPPDFTIDLVAAEPMLANPVAFHVDPRGRFFVIARSNVVSTPAANVSDTIDQNWADLDTRKADRIYAMSSGYDPAASSLEVKQLLEERLRRPMGSPAVTSFGSGAFGNRNRKFWFQIDAELIVYGATRNGALRRLRRALEEFVIEGMKTTIPLHQALLDDPEFQQGDYTIKWLEEWLARDGVDPALRGILRAFLPDGA